MQLKFDERIICTQVPIPPHFLNPSIYLSRCADSQPLPNNEINTFNWCQAQYMSHVVLQTINRRSITEKALY